jgi:hypothetical protein
VLGSAAPCSEKFWNLPTKAKDLLLRTFGLQFRGAKNELSKFAPQIWYGQAQNRFTSEDNFDPTNYVGSNLFRRVVGPTKSVSEKYLVQLSSENYGKFQKFSLLGRTK